MRNTIIRCFILLLFLNGCKKENDASYFNGEIIYVSIDSVPVSHVEGNIIELNDAYTGYMSVYDSLILFVSSKYRDRKLCVFNLNTYNLESKLISKGSGPLDFLDFIHLEQYFIQDNFLKIWGWDCIRSKIVMLNLTRSITEQNDVVDSTLFFEWKGKYSRPPGYVFNTDGFFLVRSQPEYKNSLVADNETDYIPVDYHLHRSSGERVRSYNIYGKPIFNNRKGYTLPAENYYDSRDRLKPDQTKLVIGMFMLAQINILDIETGLVKGFRLENTPDFTYLTKSPDNFRFFYRQTRVDDKYIYALYSNILESEGYRSFVGNDVHVFDWDGKLIHRIILDKTTAEIAFDPVKKQLYSLTPKDELHRYDFSFLY